MIYQAASGPVEALADISLAVGAGEFVSLVGPSGCGKSTLLRIVAGLRPTTRGMVKVAGRKPATMRSRVDLPQPLGPTSDTNSPVPTVSEMPASASTGPLAA